MPQYVQESLGAIRRRIGKMLYRRKFIQDTITAVGANTVTLPKAASLAGSSLTGGLLYIQDGPAAGLLSNVSQSEQGTGLVTVLPSFGIAPLVGNHVELWPRGDVGPDEVNEAINLAILDIQNLVSVLVRGTPVLASDRKSCTLPITSPALNKIARLSYKTADARRVSMRPRGGLDDPRGDETFWIANETTLEWNQAIPSDATDITVVGYRPPKMLTLDADLAEVRSDYLVYKAAHTLTAGAVESPALDQDGNAIHANIWGSESLKIRQALLLQHAANTRKLDDVI
jgi:hypothetical protein